MAWLSPHRGATENPDCGYGDDHRNGEKDHNLCDAIRNSAFGVFVSKKQLLRKSLGIEQNMAELFTKLNDVIFSVSSLTLPWQ